MKTLIIGGKGQLGTTLTQAVPEAIEYRKPFFAFTPSALRLTPYVLRLAHFDYRLTSWALR